MPNTWKQIMSERTQLIASTQQSATSSQEELPVYAEAIYGDAVPLYSDEKQSKKVQPKRSKMEAFKKIMMSDAHSNHMATLERAASSSGITPQPRKEKSEKQSTPKSVTPTRKLIVTGEQSRSVMSRASANKDEQVKCTSTIPG